jgi:Tfp pilus assembly protein PilF
MNILGIAIPLILLLSSDQFSSAQPQLLRERARQPYEVGVEQMRDEAFDAAAKSFEAAIAIDPTYDMAFYMLGRAHLARKQYAAAVYALIKCRDLHQAESTRVFADKQEGDRIRRERLQELERMISGLQLLRPQTFRIQEQIRQLEERKRQIQDLDRAKGFDSSRAVPAFVSLSLGSAYYRLGKLPEAEKAYVAAIAADKRIGEAHNNLAVVYMETGRYSEAEQAVKAAEAAGLKVQPDLKQEIAKRKKGSSAP